LASPSSTTIWLARSTRSSSPSTYTTRRGELFAALKSGFMISPSVDGQGPTMLAQMYGSHVVRGSGSYTGVRAVRGVYNAIVKEGISPGITPDGPRGLEPRVPPCEIPGVP
jgi:lysophospholipid acyltransferase (LPLAT)-like uncharacterized protein